jgi:hypothetical protein
MSHWHPADNNTFFKKELKCRKFYQLDFSTLFSWLALSYLSPPLAITLFSLA